MENENKTKGAESVDDLTAETAKKENSAQKEQSDSKKKNEGEKKLRGRMRLFADYQYKNVKTKSGKTKKRKVYTGKYYGYIIPKAYKKNEGAYLRKIKLTYSIVLLIMFVMWLVPSLLPKQYTSKALLAPEDFNSMTFYVMIPYLTCLLPILLNGLTVTEFVFTKKNRYERAFAEKLKQSQKGQTVTGMIAGAITVVSEFIFVILNYKNIQSAINEVMFLSFVLGYTAMCLVSLRFQAKYAMEEKK